MIKQEVNLYLALPQKAAAKLPLSQIAMIWIVVFMMMVLVYGWQSWRLDQANTELVQVKEQQKRATEQTLNLLNSSNPASLPKPDPVLAKEVAAKTSLIDMLQKRNIVNAPQLSNYLIAFSNTVPAGVWLQSIVITEGGARITLSGRSYQASSILEFMHNLEVSPAFLGRHFQLLELLPETGPSPSIKFTLDTKDE